MAALATITTTTMAIVLVVVSAASSLPAAVADADFIARTCNSTDNGHCVPVLSSDPCSLNATTERDLASIALDIAAAMARESSGAIDGEAGKHEGTAVGEALGECGSYYGEGIGALEDARERFDAGAYEDAEQRAGDAADAGDKCEKAISDRQLGSLVGDVDRRMKERCGVAADLIDLLFVVKSRRSLRA